MAKIHHVPNLKDEKAKKIVQSKHDRHASREKRAHVAELTQKAINKVKLKGVKTACRTDNKKSWVKAYYVNGHNRDVVTADGQSGFIRINGYYRKAQCRNKASGRTVGEAWVATKTFHPYKKKAKK